MQLSFFDKQVFYYTLWSIRNPELWFEQNSKAKNSKTRFENRLKLKQQVEETCYRFCCNDQLLFASIDSVGEILLLQGEILNTTSMSIEEVVLKANLDRQLVICEMPDGQLWQSATPNWIRVKQRSKTKELAKIDEALNKVKEEHVLSALEIERDLIFIRARKRELELQELEVLSV